MTRTKIFYLRIDLHKEVWAFEIYRNASFTFHFDYLPSENYQSIELVLLGISIEFHRSLLGWKLACIVSGWWQKLIAFCAGANICDDYASFREIEHGEHFRWFLKLDA